MGAFFDKLERLIVDNSPRVLSLLILLAVVAGFGYLATGVLNLKDSPTTRIGDRFDVPTFAVTLENFEGQEETQSFADSRDEPRPEQWTRDYRAEIANIVEDLYPFYVAFFSFDVSDERRQFLTDFTIEQLLPSEEAFNREQMNGVVEGLEKYISDFSEHYANVFDIDGLEIDEIIPGSISDQDFEQFLSNPFNEYLAGVESAYELHLEQVQIAELEAQNNQSGAGAYFLIAGGSIAAGVFLVLLFILFKMEQSIRKSVDALEKNLTEDS